MEPLQNLGTSNMVFIKLNSSQGLSVHDAGFFVKLKFGSAAELNVI